MASTNFGSTEGGLTVTCWGSNPPSSGLMIDGSVTVTFRSSVELRVFVVNVGNVHEGMGLLVVESFWGAMGSAKEAKFFIGSTFFMIDLTIQKFSSFLF